MAKVPKQHRWVFWDVDAGGLETKRDAGYIAPRVLELGRLAEVRYGRDGIHSFLRNVGHPELTDRTLQFWRVALHAEQERWASPPAWRGSSAAPWIDRRRKALP